MMVNIFSVLVDRIIVLFIKYLFRSSAPFKIRSVFCCWVVRVLLCILYVSSSLGIRFANVFFTQQFAFSSWWWFLLLFRNFLAWHSPICLFASVSFVFGVRSIKTLLKLMSISLHMCFLLRIWCFKSYIQVFSYFQLIFLKYSDLISFLNMWLLSFPNTIIKETFLSLLYILSSFVVN